MKKQLTVALGLAVLATPALASKARLQALGESVDGSFYINDNRNIFLNAAQVNNHKDMITFEWGDTTNALDRSQSPRAEGGFLRAHNNLVWGLHLGSESNSSNLYRTLAGAAVAEENNIDFFVGGDAGVKWGANVTYSRTQKNELSNDAEASAMRTRFGVIAGDLEAWANINISNKAEVGDVEFKGKLGYRVGAVYNLNDYKLFADYQSLDGESEGGATDFDIKSKQLQVGAARASKLNDKATLFTRVSYVTVNAENEGTTNGLAVAASCSAQAAVGCEEYKSNSLPVVIGLEYDAASWLVLRSSVSQNVLIGSEEDKDNKRGLQETTRVNAGATLKFGELSVDGVIGNGAAAAGAETNDGVFNTEDLMSRVSMTYRF